MTTEGVLVDTSQGPPQMMQQPMHPQQQQAPQQQMQQQTAMAAPPPSSGPMGAMLDAQQNGTNGTIRPQRGNSGDGCCDNARERAKDAVAKVAPCACKLLYCSRILVRLRLGRRLMYLYFMSHRINVNFLRIFIVILSLLYLSMTMCTRLILDTNWILEQDLGIKKFDNISGL